MNCQFSKLGMWCRVREAQNSIGRSGSCPVTYFSESQILYYKGPALFFQATPDGYLWNNQ